MPRNGELIFAVAIVNGPPARLRLFAPWRRRFACWRLGHRSTIPSVLVIAVQLGLFPCYGPSRLTCSLCCSNRDSVICDSHHVLKRLPLNQSLSLTCFMRLVCIKPNLDVLQRYALIANDSPKHVRRLVVEFEVEDGCRVHLKAMAPRVINPRAAVETIGGTEALFCHAERLELSRD